MAKAAPEHQCHHIKESGERCGAPHMKKKQFCFFHLKLNEDFSLPGQAHYEAPALDNLQAVVLALTHVQRAQAKRLISSLEAKAMTYTINSARDTLRMIQKSTPISPDPANIETEFTPGMRRLLWLDEDENEKQEENKEMEKRGKGRPRPFDRCEAPALDGDQPNNNDLFNDEAEGPFLDQSVALVEAPVSTFPDPPYSTWTFEQLSTQFNMNVCALYFGFTSTGERLPPDPPEPEVINVRRRPHPLADAIGLRPWGTHANPNAAPRWVMVTEEELEKMEAAGMPLLHEPHTREQAWNKRRLDISQRLPDREKATAAELLSTIAKVEARDAELAPGIEQDRRNAAIRKAAEEAEDRA